MRPLIGVCAAAAALAAGSSAQALTITATPCPHQRDFFCGVMNVPLDHSRHVPGRIALHFAEQAPDGREVLIALSGGPGQGAVQDASSFAQSLSAATDRYRLAVLDQRGTGASGALDCAPLQRLSELSTLSASLDAQCATSIGPRRAFYSTTDTVFDIDALRAALGVRKVALMGVSYGTFVAEQYARRFPTHVSRLILDSVVPPHGIDAFSLDSYARMGRVLRAQCARGLCDGITRDPVADVAALDRRLTGHLLRALVPDARGRRTPVVLSNPGELANLVLAGDSNAFLQPALPGAIVSALRGDPAPLLRLRRIAVGPPTPRTVLSAGLNIATFCEDSELPYSVATTPLSARPQLIVAALDAIAPSRFGPVSRDTVLSTSIAQACAQWPRDWFHPASHAPMPNVPALILDGELDLRTPVENGVAVAAELPRAKMVVVPGVGHDVLDSDSSDCALRALDRFVRDVAVGSPCRGKRKANQIAPYPVAPTSLGALVPPRGAHGTEGRIVAAAALTITDGYASSLQRAFAGFSRLYGGGLRSGRFVANLSGSLHLIGYSYIPGVRVSGNLDVLFGQGVGAVYVDGPGHFDGRLQFGENGAVDGRIDGHFVNARIGNGVSAARAGAHAGAPVTRPADIGAWLRRARRVQGRAVAG